MVDSNNDLEKNKTLSSQDFELGEQRDRISNRLELDFEPQFDVEEHSEDEQEQPKVEKKADFVNKKIIIISGLVAVLLAIAIGAYYFFLGSKDTLAPVTVEQTQPSVPVEVPTTPPEAAPTDEATSTTETPSETAKVLVDESLLNQPISDNPTLVEEEMAKLAELERQLEEQQNNLKAQEHNVDDLLRLTEEQIKALEEQLAQQPQ